MPIHSLAARPAVQALRSSKIREVANAGMGKEDVIAFWFGEPDEVTPAFIRRAGIEALERGETFYTQNLGIPELRAALATYVSRLHRPAGTTPLSVENIAVTSSGMSALMLATQALVGAGDRVVIVTPVWPNLVEIPKILGAQALGELHQLDQFLVEDVEFGMHGRTINLKTLLSQSVTECFASALEFSPLTSGRICTALRCRKARAFQLNGKQVRKR